MSELFAKLEKYMRKGKAFEVALAMLEWDQETLAPVEAEENTSQVVGELSDAYMEVMVNEEVRQCLKEIEGEKQWSQLTEDEQAIVKEWKLIFRQLEYIPKDEYKEYATLTARAPVIWSKAKAKKQFEAFAPTLKKIVEYKKKFAGYRKEKDPENKDLCLYDILLEDYEPGFNQKILDEFFDKLKEELVPLLNKVKEACKNVDKSYNSLSYPVDEQREFCCWLSAYQGFDLNKGVIGESAHPFTTNFHNHDVRISNHFYENNLESAIFSVIHETGHAMYEMGIANAITMTPVGTGTSMGMHESQSRFWENIIGRSKEFWVPIYPKLQEYFPKQLSNVDLDSFIQGVNRIEPGLIRTEADELSYAMHVLVRYQLEKQLISGEIDVDDLEQAWRVAYKKYLGIEPKNAAEGVLQDIHWACGDFGYFPSYAIGTAVAAQIYYHMKEKMPMEEYLKEGNLTPIREYLKEHIYQFGKKKTTQQLLKEMTGEEFCADYYVKYLKEKYQILYLD